MSGRNLNVVNAASLVRVRDRGEVRRGAMQNELDIVHGGAVAIRDGVIVAAGATSDVLAGFGEPGVPTIDATGRSVLPGLVDCHSHPIFDGERHDEYAERLGGASLADVAARGGGIWRSVVATRGASDEALLGRLRWSYRRLLAGGITTLEVKSGYGLTVAEELRELDLLQRSRSLTPLDLVITFLGAHVVPRDLDAPPDQRGDLYTALVDEMMMPAVVAQGVAQFHDVTVESGYFTPEQALRLMRRSLEVGLPVRVHADAWATSRGWATAVAGGAVSADHLTYTPDDEIREVGRASTVAVVLPIAELLYMTDRRANARLLIDQN
ncbi:MAG: imidazolonepropionase, partial [Acidimicrobiaceae bacterium]